MTNYLFPINFAFSPPLLHEWNQYIYIYVTSLSATSHLRSLEKHAQVLNFQNGGHGEKKP